MYHHVGNVCSTFCRSENVSQQGVSSKLALVGSWVQWLNAFHSSIQYRQGCLIHLISCQSACYSLILAYFKVHSAVKRRKTNHFHMLYRFENSHLEQYYKAGRA
jgi:hypothetical protein